MEVRVCTICNQEFRVEDDDLAFYERIKVPSPKFCPDDRYRRRAAFRNERNFYRRKCDATGKDIISMYSPDKPFKIYEQNYWWGDNWSAFDDRHGFDFNKPFFEQFRQLQLLVPRLSLYNYNSENSYYTNHSGDNKNCYMAADLGGCEDVIYSNWLTHSKDCIDCSYTYSSELCYFCLYCERCFNSNFCVECNNLTDCYGCYDCKACRNCFGCAGLRNQEFYVFNKKVTQEEYKKIIEQYSYSYHAQKKALEKLRAVWQSFPHRYAVIIESEDCTGDYIYHCKNANQCFDVVNLWDCKYCYNTLDTKNGYDCYQPGFLPNEQIYEIHAGGSLYNSKFLSLCRNLRDSLYCDICFDSDNLFGCIGVKHGSYCILNKKYSKEEYEKWKAKIIEHMKRTGEYGEFFPFWVSTFGYNESKAQEYFPLSREEVVKIGANWSDYQGPLLPGEIYELPDDIRDINDGILEKVIICGKSGKAFKIIKQELDFYRRKKLPIPRLCPQKRYEERMSFRRPRHLWDRTCAKCAAAIKTTYAPRLGGEIVYCEKCYLEAVY